MGRPIGSGAWRWPSWTEGVAFPSLPTCVGRGQRWEGVGGLEPVQPAAADNLVRQQLARGCAVHVASEERQCEFPTTHGVVGKRSHRCPQ